MFAVLAIVAGLLATFNISLGGLNFLALAVTFIACHLAFGSIITIPRRG